MSSAAHPPSSAQEKEKEQKQRQSGVAANVRPVDADVEASLTETDNVSGLGKGFKEPSTRLTAHQAFYLFGLDGVGAFALSGGINFAIAYAMYTTQTYNDSNLIRLFQLPNTLAGDMAVTIFIQCIITWLVEMVLVNRDLRIGGVQAIGFVPEPRQPLLRWFLFLDLDDEAARAGGGVGRWLRFLSGHVVRALLTTLPMFVLLFGPGVGLLTLVGTPIPWGAGSDWTYATKWAPQVFKLLLGGVLSLFTGPAFAALWLVRCGWALQKNEARYGAL